MSWPLREIPNPWDKDLLHDDAPWEPGFCWRAPALTPESIHAPEWLASGRDYFIWIVIPMFTHEGVINSLFTPDRLSSNGVSGWTVTGELPNITITPSIGAADYHGWVTDGVLSDDIEGRTYASQT